MDQKKRKEKISETSESQCVNWDYNKNFSLFKKKDKDLSSYSFLLYL